MTEKTEYRKGFMLIPEESLGPCDNCGNGTVIKFCKKYGGYIGKCTTCNVQLEGVIMTRKPGSARQQKLYSCKECEFVAKKHSALVLHMKEAHGIEL